MTEKSELRYSSEYIEKLSNELNEAIDEIITEIGSPPSSTHDLTRLSAILYQRHRQLVSEFRSLTGKNMMEILKERKTSQPQTDEQHTTKEGDVEMYFDVARSVTALEIVVNEVRDSDQNLWSFINSIETKKIRVGEVDQHTKDSLYRFFCSGEKNMEASMVTITKDQKS